jgi:bifunctional non-homologous end joining protein LigD
MARAIEMQVGDIVISCTNVDRVVFADGAITKGDVIAFYRDIAGLALPELRGRPLTLERFTKGIEAGGFFQKHWQKHFPSWLDHIAVPGKTPVTYPICDTQAGLVYFANQGAIALHVWTSRKAKLDRSGFAGARSTAEGRSGESIEHPDLLVFDLDPPEGRFELARDAARLVRAALDELALPAFVKTTGGKGLHVVTPLDGHATFAEVAALTDAISKRLCARHPDRLTMEFYKKDRGDRLFLDTMRNAPGATFIAAYSLRGRPHAPVSAPVTWEELEDPQLRADSFTLRNLPEVLQRRGDPWRDLRVREGSVATAMRAFSASEKGSG